jgi:hypothetical protein
MDLTDCPECGREVSTRADTCPKCGWPLNRRVARSGQDIGDDVGIRMLLPVGRSGWAIAAGYLGLVSVLCIPGPLALFAGIMAVIEIRRDPKKHGMGRAIFGIVMGGIGSVLLAIWLIALIVELLTKSN